MPAVVLIVARMVWMEPVTGLKRFSLIFFSAGTVMVSGLLQIGIPDITAGSIVAGFLVPALCAG